MGGAMQNTPAIEAALTTLAAVPTDAYAVTTEGSDAECDWYVCIEAGGLCFMVTRDEVEICDERGRRIEVLTDADDLRAWDACKIADRLFDAEAEHQMSEANERAAMEANDRAMNEWCCKNL